MNMLNSTVSGNFAVAESAQGGGIFGEDATVSIYSSTITANQVLGLQASGGGLAMGSTNAQDQVLLIENTIISNNSATGQSAQGPDIKLPAAGIGDLSVRYSLIGTQANPSLLSLAGLSGKLFGTPSDPLDARLGPLEDNGGGTLTHLPLGNSPAVNAGDPNIDLSFLARI